MEEEGLRVKKRYQGNREEEFKNEDESDSRNG